MKQGARGRGGVCAAVLLPAGLALALGLPSAAAGLVAKKNTVTIPGIASGEDNDGGMRFQCKGARHAFAVGFATDFRPDGGPQILPTTTRKDDARTWVIGAGNDGPKAGRLTGYAYCRKSRRLMNSRSAFAAFPRQRRQRTTARVRCRTGQGRVVSGGFSLGSGLRIDESRKAHRRAWMISVYNPTDEWISFDGFAYCRPGPDTKPRHNAVRVRSGETARVTARCNPNERLLSGGFANPDFNAEGGPQMFPHLSRRAGKKHRWTVAAHNAGDASGMLVAFAYCRDG